MALIFNLLLLAACSTHVVGGPVPRNPQRLQFTGYFNSSSTISSVSQQQTVQADTAIVVEPIQETVFTSIAPAITFVNPNGQPLVTQDPQTVLSTSFITPTPKPTSDKSSTVLSLSVTTPDPRQTPTGNSPLPTLSPVTPPALSSTVKAVENVTTSASSRQIPRFTYSPAEKQSSTSLASPTDVASKPPVPTSGGMPGFQHPGSPASTQQPSNSSSSPTIVASSVVSSIVPSGSPVVSSSRSDADLKDTTSRIVVTSYTTVYASAPLPDAATTASATPGSGSATPTQTQQSNSSFQLSSKVTKQPTCSGGQGAASSVTSSPGQALPSGSLQVPPVVIVTSFTTVMASLGPSSMSLTPASSVVPEPVVSSPPALSSASKTASSSAKPTPPANSTSSPSSSSPTSSTLAKPTSSVVLSPEPPVQPSSSTTPPASASVQPTPSSTPPSPVAPTSTSNVTSSPSAPTSVSSASSPPPPAPEPTLSSSISSSTTTSEGPLIITPIPPSQVFTVTETATKTEKETIRETVTVTAS